MSARVHGRDEVDAVIGTPDSPSGLGIGHPRPVTSPGLDERDLAVLAFEQEWWRHAGGRDQAVRERFGLDPIAYHRLLGELIDRPEAEAAEPLLVRRLRRQRAARRRDRADRRQPR